MTTLLPDRLPHVGGSRHRRGLDWLVGAMLVVLGVVVGVVGVDVMPVAASSAVAEVPLATVIYGYDVPSPPVECAGVVDPRGPPCWSVGAGPQRVGGREAAGALSAVRSRGFGVAAKTGSAVTKGEEIVGTTHNAVRPTQDWINPDQVDAYAKALQAGEKIEPIEIQRLPDGREFLLDGHHRYAASMRTGLMVPRIYYEGEGPRGFPDWTHVFPEEP